MQSTTISLKPGCTPNQVHSKRRPMNDVGAPVKNNINNALAFQSIISCNSEFWDHLPKDHKQIGMHEDDIFRYIKMVTQDLKITSKSY